MNNERVQPAVYFEDEESNDASVNQPSGYEESDTEDDYNLVNMNEIRLKIGDLFNDWASVQMVMDSYAKQNGFVANKCRKDLDPIDKSIIRRRGLYLLEIWCSSTKEGWRHKFAS